MRLQTQSSVVYFEHAQNKHHRMTFYAIAQSVVGDCTERTLAICISRFLQRLYSVLNTCQRGVAAKDAQNYQICYLYMPLQRLWHFYSAVAAVCSRRAHIAHTAFSRRSTRFKLFAYFSYFKQTYFATIVFYFDFSTQFVIVLISRLHV